jgi:hypothetical protein
MSTHEMPKWLLSLAFPSFCDVTSARPTMELLTFSRFWNFRSRNARISCLQDSRNVEPRFTRNGFPFGTFPELLDFRHASSYDGRSSIISRFHKIKCRYALASCPLDPRSPDLRNVDGLPISATCLNRWTTQICFRVFAMEIPDLLSSRLPIFRSSKSLYPDSFETFTLLFTKFKPHATSGRSND